MAITNEKKCFLEKVRYLRKLIWNTFKEDTFETNADLLEQLYCESLLNLYIHMRNSRPEFCHFLNVRIDQARNSMKRMKVEYDEAVDPDQRAYWASVIALEEGIKE